MEKRLPMTLGKAIDKYIEAKTATLSPSTIRGYKAMRRNYFPGIIDKNVSNQDLRYILGLPTGQHDD